MYPLLNNPNKHFYTTRNDAVDLIVLHVTAGLQDLDMVGVDHSARKTNEYGATVKRPASWHSCVDSDSIEAALPDNYTAFHAAGYNSESLGLEICNNDARWDNKSAKWTRATLRNAAKVCLAWEKKFKIPRRLLTKAQVDAGARGYTYHMFLDPDRRSDPGKTFPVQLFFRIIAELNGETAPTAKPSCVKLQTALRVNPVDNKWGATTDKHGHAVVEASTYGGQKFPYGVAFTQRVIGAVADGQWGPKSVEAHRNTVVAVQRALTAMGFSVPAADGIWGNATQSAYMKARTACHI